MSKENEDIIVLAGKITRSDAEEAERIIPALAKAGRLGAPPQITLDSPGGDLQSAMRIGRLLRKYGFRATVYKVPKDRDGICASACVFVLAGAVERIHHPTSSTVAIHRPFVEETTETNVKLAEQRNRDMRKFVASYLEEMNVHPALAEDMMSVSPGSSHKLSVPELLRYRLLGDDPVHEEIQENKEARKWGLSRSEYMARRSQASRECPTFLPNGRLNELREDCEAGIMRGER